MEVVQIIDGKAVIISHELQLLGLASSDRYNPNFHNRVYPDESIRLLR